MKKWMKVLAIVAGVLVLLVAVLAILVKVLVTPERIREVVLPKAREALHRELSLGEIEVSLFSGVRINDLAVKDRQGEENFIAADQVVLHYRLWPLLQKRVVISELLLVGPHIRIERLADGSFNFSDLIPTEEGGAEKAAPPVSAGEGAPIDLLVSRVAVSKGELLFFDHTLNNDAPYRYQLDALDFQARDITLEKPFPFELGASLNGAPLQVDGTANAGDSTGNVKVSLSDFDITAFAPYYRDQLPGKLERLVVDLDLTAGGSPTQLTSKGKVLLRNLNLTLKDLPDAPLTDVRLGLDYDASYEVASSRLTLAGTSLDFNGITVRVAGVVDNREAGPVVDLNIDLPDLNLRSALAAVPAKLVEPLAGLDPAGSLKGTMHLSGIVGDVEKLVQSGELQFQELAASAGSLRPSLTGKAILKLSAKDYAEELREVRLAVVGAQHPVAQPVERADPHAADAHRRQRRVIADEEQLREYLAGEGLDVSSWSNGPHERYGEHRHSFDKVLVAASGSIVFHLPELDRDVTLEQADRLDLPAGTLHGADVGPAGVTCLEAHLPAGSLAAKPERHAKWQPRDR